MKMYISQIAESRQETVNSAHTILGGRGSGFRVQGSVFLWPDEYYLL
jgi:hypothetical protein